MHSIRHSLLALALLFSFAACADDEDLTLDAAASSGSPGGSSAGQGQGQAGSGQGGGALGGASGHGGAGQGGGAGMAGVGAGGSSGKWGAPGGASGSAGAGQGASSGKGGQGASAGQGGSAGEGPGGSSGGGSGSGGPGGSSGKGGAGPGPGGSSGEGGAGGGSGEGGSAGQGGQAGGSGSAGASGGSGGAGQAGAAGFVAVGSYNVDFPVTKRHCPSLWSGDEGAGTSARIDLGKDESGAWIAVVALFDEPPGSFWVTDEPDRLVLKGMAPGRYEVTLDGGHTMEWWRKFIIHKTLDGLGGAVEASGEIEGDNGDGGGDVAVCLPGGNLSATGKLAADVISPTGRYDAHPALPGRPGEPLLPWDPVSFVVTEPVDHAALKAALDAAFVQHNPTLPAPSWLPPDFVDSGTPWVGIQRLEARGPWLPGSLLQLTLLGEIPDADPSGNALQLVSPLVEVSVLDLAPAAPSFGFDASGPGTWGSASFVAGGDGSPCEEGGCIDLGEGPVECPLPISGVAARLSPPAGATSVKIRLRTQHDTASPSTCPLSAEVHGSTKWSDPCVSTPWSLGVEDLGPLVKLRYQSPWRTVTLPLPDPGPDGVVGVVLYKGPGKLLPKCFLNPLVGESSRVLIDRVWAE